MQTIVQINMGEGINPAGSGRDELPLHAYRVKFLEGGVGESRKTKGSMGIRVKVKVLAPAMVGDESTAGREIEDWLNLPEGNDFSQDTTKGRGNRARVAEIKALWVGFGVDRAQAAAWSGSMSLDFGQLVGREAVIFYEPSLPGEQGSYPEMQYLASDLGEKAMNNQYRPKLKNVKASVGPATGTAFPVGGSAGTPPSAGFSVAIPPGSGPTFAAPTNASAADNGAGAPAATNPFARVASA